MMEQSIILIFTVEETRLGEDKSLRAHEQCGKDSNLNLSNTRTVGNSLLSLRVEKVK